MGLPKELAAASVTSTRFEPGHGMVIALLDDNSMLVLQKGSFSRNSFGKHIVSVR